MREIKYRGKSLEDGKWLYGSLLIENPPLQCFATDEKEADKYYIAKSGFADWNMPRPFDIQEVDPKTVGQYTGKKDKNGKEVYEDDRIADDEYIYLQVNWDNNSCKFSVDGYGHRMYRNEGSGEEYSKDISLLDKEVIYIEDSGEYEVIGNAHDNK